MNHKVIVIKTLQNPEWIIQGHISISIFDSVLFKVGQTQVYHNNADEAHRCVCRVADKPVGGGAMFWTDAVDTSGNSDSDALSHVSYGR